MPADFKKLFDEKTVAIITEMMGGDLVLKELVTGMEGHLNMQEHFDRQASSIAGLSDRDSSRNQSEIKRLQNEGNAARAAFGTSREKILARVVELQNATSVREKEDIVELLHRQNVFFAGVAGVASVVAAILSAWSINISSRQNDLMEDQNKIAREALVFSRQVEARTIQETKSKSERVPSN